MNVPNHSVPHHPIPPPPHGILPNSPHMQFDHHPVHSSHGHRGPHQGPHHGAYPTQSNHHPQYHSHDFHNDRHHVQHWHPAANHTNIGMPWHEGQYVTAAQYIMSNSEMTNRHLEGHPNLSSPRWQNNSHGVFPHGTPILHGSRVEDPLQPHPHHYQIFHTPHPDIDPHMYDTKLPRVVGPHDFKAPRPRSGHGNSPYGRRQFYEDLRTHSPLRHSGSYSNEPEINPRLYDTPRPRDPRHHDFNSHLHGQHSLGPAAHAGYYPSPNPNFHPPHNFYSAVMGTMNLPNSFMSTYGIHPPTPVPHPRPRMTRRKRVLKKSNIEPTMDKIVEDITENDTDSDEESHTITDNSKEYFDDSREQTDRSDEHSVEMRENSPEKSKSKSPERQRSPEKQNSPSKH